MSKLNTCLQEMHLNSLKCCLLRLLIGLASLYSFHYIYKRHTITRHWLNVCTHPSNCKVEWYQSEIIPVYRTAFEPVSVKDHVEWHAAFNQSTEQHLRLMRSQWTAFVGLILRQFNVTDRSLMLNTSAPDILSTCVETLAEHQRLPLSRKCSSLLERIMNVGRMPPEIINSPNLMKTFRQNNPVDEYSKIYLDPISLSDASSHSTMVNLTCDIVSRQRRSSLYRMLQQWIRLAEENNIMWWLSCGTLLGAVRDGNMIPYDHDVDISVLDSAEPKLRKLGRALEQIQNGQFNLILRPGPHCTSPEGIRQNCYGQTVNTYTDSCSFCEPVARVFYDPRFAYMDIYAFHLEIRFDNEQLPIEFGYFDESSDRSGSGLHGLFPLRSCKFLGLDVPCPRDPATLLGPQYGENFIKPCKWCNLARRDWVKSS